MSVVLFMCVAALAGCGSGGGAGGAGGGGGGGKASAVTLDGLGIKAEVPEGTTVGKAIGGPGAMLTGPVVATITEAGDTRPKTVEEAKTQAQDYTPVNLKEEKLADGFVLTFENKGSMGSNYWVYARREIGGKAFWCETTASTPEQQSGAAAVCKSLAP